MDRGQRFVRHDHDHQACVADALTEAEALCRARGAKLTALRRRVLEMVWDSHSPVGAYELLDRLRAEGRSGAPPTVYRALDFLAEFGLVHRLSSLNAFIGCAHPGQSHAGQFLICTGCRRVLELAEPGIAAAVSAGARRTGFKVSAAAIEVSGLCPDCQRAAA
ncbi:MAG: transcriptional repressor [Alphaproteobacteria bacterium]|nr:transcriptional repressor [Alphaproteobacteria bacterium]